MGIFDVSPNFPFTTSETSALFNIKSRVFLKHSVRACRYLVLLGPGYYDVIYNRIRYLTNLKSGITCNFSHCFAEISDFYDFFLTEKY